MNRDQVQALLYEALETEQGGIEVYQAAVRCAIHTTLKEEWGEYLTQTRNHEQIVRGLLEAFGLDPEAPPGVRW